MDSFEGSSKKHALEDLAKEELIHKYKGLLALAQKAKQAKDALIKENAELKKLLDDIEQSECKKQVRALTDENTKLASNLSDVEAQITELKRIGLIQQEQLLSLEKLKPSDANNESGDLLGANEKLKEKLRLYHSKIVKFAQDVKHLKRARQDLIATFGSYVLQVSEWKTQLETLLHRIEQNQKEMHELKMQNETLFCVQEENSKLKGYLKVLQANFQDEKGAEDVFQPHESEDLHTILDGHIKRLQARNLHLEDEVRSAEKNNSKRLEETSELEAVFRSLINECADNDMQLAKQCETLKTKCDIELEYVKTELEDKEEFDGDLIRLARALKTKVIKQKCLTNNMLSIAIKEVVSEGEKTESTTQTTDTYEEDMRKLKSENLELLSEMNEMNEVLKERGETISKQQTFCDKMVDTLNQKEDLIKTLQRELQSNNHKTIPASEETLREKDKIISTLKSELEDLRSKLLNANDEGIAESETMSVSTISKNEDLTRMKDLESSWEERYGKLRNLALKLKRKTTDLTADLSREQAEKTELQQKLNKTIGTFQQQMDRTQDELETCKSDSRAYLKKIETLSADLARDKRLLASNEDLMLKLRTELEVLTKEKAETENWKKQVSSKVQTLKNELKVNALLKKDSDSKIAKLVSEVEAKEKAFKNEADKHAQTKTSLQESLDECKRLSLLNLELRDYENVAKDISHDLDKKQEIITGLKNQADSYRTNVSELQAQKKRLEDDAKSLETNFARIKSENELQTNKISELEKFLLERELRLQSLSHALEDSKLENEDLTRQLSDTMIEHERLNVSLRTTEDQLKSQNLGLEQKLRGIQEALKLKDDELSEARKDYESYKIRAKSFMQRSRDFGAEEKLAEEVSRWKGQVEMLQEEVNALKCAVEHEKEENGEVSSKYCQLLKENETMRNEIDDNKRKYEQLQFEHQSSITEHVEAVRSLKLHTEKLTEYYQQQLLDQEARHNMEISELQNSAPSSVPLLASPSMMVREEGEGSENVDGNNTGNVNPLSLERLLSGNESDKAEKQLSENEIKVSHLTALLADAEQDLAKHVQMNKVLKEEIRRQQRCAEREKHAENMEYLKNVVFKFLTLGNGDERTRLVPVLNTILKLNPEENRKLLMVSKGDRGWASYLPGGWRS